MKKFIFQTVSFTIVSISTIVFILSLADGHSDAFYLKLTAPKKTNLILGTSKAAQGLQPKVINEVVKKEFYNFAFAIDSSPYGPVYLNSIKEKLDKSKKDNVFIVTVDAWSISSKNNDPNNSEKFRENKTYLNNSISINQDINYEYLLKYFDREYYTILTKSSPGFLHDDGWLEATLDENESERRTVFSIKNYAENSQFYNFSSTRLLFLENTIDYLKKYGQVYMVRLPVGSELNKIEEKLLPNFNTIILPATKKSNGFLDLTKVNKDLKFTDGVHLQKESGAKVSKMIAEYIANQRKNNTTSLKVK